MKKSEKYIAAALAATVALGGVAITLDELDNRCLTPMELAVAMAADEPEVAAVLGDFDIIAMEPEIGREFAAITGAPHQDKITGVSVLHPKAGTGVMAILTTGNGCAMKLETGFAVGDADWKSATSLTLPKFIFERLMQQIGQGSATPTEPVDKEETKPDDLNSDQDA